jgi:hypothetical protein
MSDRFYLRKAFATVFQAGQEANARRINTRLRFKCEKMSAGYLNPSSATLDLYNLSKETKSL